MIESRIVIANDSFNKNLGARLGFQDHTMRNASDAATSNWDLRTAFGGKLEAPGYVTRQAADIPTFNDQGLNVNMSAGSIGGIAPGVVSMVLFKAGASKFLNLELSALQADGKGKTISNPRVLTADQMEATIEQGTEIPYLQASSSGATTVSFKKAVLSLKVKPQITPDDNIIMDLKINNDEPDYLHITAGVPPLLTKQVSTQVLVENGGTVVIGGIYTQKLDDTTTKVPLLGDIPVIGFLFKNKITKDEKNELLIFVTPKILKDSLNLR
jgi:type IV pilus assembly protein PilQ